MNYRSDILIAHPGKHHVLHLVAGCVRSGFSVHYFTPFYRCGFGRCVAMLYGDIGAKARGYYHPGIPSKVVISPFSQQCAKLLSFFRNESRYEKAFDIATAGFIDSGRFRARIVVTLQDYMPETVKAAKKKRMSIWSDQILNQSKEVSERIFSHERSINICSKLRHSEAMNHSILAMSDLVTVPSNYCLSGISDQVPVNAKLVTIPYGANVVNFGATRKKEEKEIVIVARANSVRKGGHLLLKALGKCSEDLVTIGGGKRLRIVILGRINRELEDLLESTQFAKELELVHQDVPHSKVTALYLKGALFLMPSLSEGRSLACVEAMQAKLPLIITRFCGVDGFVDGEMGYMIEDNVESLASALIRAMENRHLWQKWGENAFQLAKTLTWDIYENRIAQMVQDSLR